MDYLNILISPLQHARNIFNRLYYLPDSIKGLNIQSYHEYFIPAIHDYVAILLDALYLLYGMTINQPR